MPADNQPSVTELEQKVADHPMLLEAKAQPHGTEGGVALWERHVIERGLIEHAVQQRVLRAIKPGGKILFLNYFTSEKPPGFLSGHGWHYAFLFHPETFEFLGATKGAWRA